MTSEEVQRISNEELRINEYPFTIRLLSAEDGGGYLIEYPDVPGCMSDGETPEEAILNGKDALRSVLLTKIEFGDPIPAPGLSLRVLAPVHLDLDIHRYLTETAERRGTTLSDLVNELLKRDMAIIEAVK